MTTVEELRIEIEKLTNALNGLSLGEIRANREELIDEMEKLNLLFIDFNAIIKCPKKNNELNTIYRDEENCSRRILLLLRESDKYLSVQEIGDNLGIRPDYVRFLLNQFKETKIVNSIEDKHNQRKMLWGIKK
jgi:hypothetical protein